MNDDARELGQMFMIWKLHQKVFLQMLVERLIKDVPGFDAEALITKLHVLQEKMPVHDEDTQVAAHARVGLGFLGEFVELTEAAIADAKPVDPGAA